MSSKQTAAEMRKQLEEEEKATQGRRQQMKDELARLKASEANEERAKRKREAERIGAEVEGGREEAVAWEETLKPKRVVPGAERARKSGPKVEWGEGECTPCKIRGIECRPQTGYLLQFRQALELMGHRHRQWAVRRCFECKAKHVRCYWDVMPQEKQRRDSKVKVKAGPEDEDSGYELVTGAIDELRTGAVSIFQDEVQGMRKDIQVLGAGIRDGLSRIEAALLGSEKPKASKEQLRVFIKDAGTLLAQVLKDQAEANAEEDSEDL